MKKLVVISLVLLLLISTSTLIFADSSGKKSKPIDPDQNPTEFITDTVVTNGANKAVGDTQKQFAIMGMSGYILAKTVVNYVALIIALFVFAQYMISARNANKRGDAIGNIGHFLLSLGLYFAITWIFNLVWKFANNLDSDTAINVVINVAQMFIA